MIRAEELFILLLEEYVIVDLMQVLKMIIFNIMLGQDGFIQ